MVNLTEMAVEKFKEVIQGHGIGEAGVRLFVVPGG